MLDRQQQFLDSVVEAGGFTKLYNYTRYRVGDVSGVENALDIGGGAGILSFYIASEGAKRVVCLEPESAGSTDNVTCLFETLKRSVPFGERVELVPRRLQE